MTTPADKSITLSVQEQLSPAPSEENINPGPVYVCMHSSPTDYKDPEVHVLVE